MMNAPTASDPTTTTGLAAIADAIGTAMTDAAHFALSACQFIVGLIAFLVVFLVVYLGRDRTRRRWALELIPQLTDFVRTIGEVVHGSSTKGDTD